ncbi:MAG: molybdopterin converting factor subunit 1 [Rhodospirillales bacterium]|nr:molybdopterin converting factor subunit 1 [Rhodospirillales bacterium]
MRLLYFAWIRQRIGRHEETVERPPEVTDVDSLIAWLRNRGPGYAEALKDASAVRVAVNQEYVPLKHPVRDGDEVALFPPVTGG